MLTLLIMKKDVPNKNLKKDDYVISDVGVLFHEVTYGEAAILAEADFPYKLKDKFEVISKEKAEELKQFEKNPTVRVEVLQKEKSALEKTLEGKDKELDELKKKIAELEKAGKQK